MISNVGNQQPQSILRGQLSLLSFTRMTLDPPIAGLLLVGTGFHYPVLVFALAAIAVALLTYAWRRLSRQAQSAS